MAPASGQASTTRGGGWSVADQAEGRLSAQVSRACNYRHAWPGNPVARKGHLRDSPSDPWFERRWQVATDLGMHAGYVLMNNGQCCDDKIYSGLGQTAELAAWWQRNRAGSGDVITVGAITELAIPVDTLRRMHPVRGSLSPDWPGDGFEGWEDPGPPPG